MPARLPASFWSRRRHSSSFRLAANLNSMFHQSHHSTVIHQSERNSNLVRISRHLLGTCRRPSCRVLHQKKVHSRVLPSSNSFNRCPRHCDSLRIIHPMRGASIGHAEQVPRGIIRPRSNASSFPHTAITLTAYPAPPPFAQDRGRSHSSFAHPGQCSAAYNA